MRQKLRIISLTAFTLLPLMICNPAWGQTGTITGTVTDVNTSETLPGVNVILQGTQQGTSTGADGNYTISEVKPGTYTVVASFIGYAQATQEVVVNAEEEAQANFQLQQAAVSMDEVVAVGYGEQQREDVTGSIQGIDSENLETVPVSSPTEALQGQISGLSIGSATGLPGGGPTIQLRGLGSVGAGGQPLYVVDGFALSTPGRGESLSRNPLADIPSSDIASIDVLKDASATAIYGSRGSNGVIIIETKSGSSGRFDINASASSTVKQSMDRMRLIHGGASSAQQFLEFQNFIWQDRDAAVPEAYQNPDQYSGPSVNWWNQINETAYRHNVHASVRGGNESIQSFFSVDVTRDEGMIQGHDFNRISARANLDSNPTEDLSFGLRLAPTFTTRDINWEGGTARGGIGGSTWMMSPIEPVRKDDGTFNRQIGDESPGVWSHPNPILWLQEQRNNEEQLTGLGSAFAEYEFTEGVSLRAQGNVELRKSETKQFNPSIIGGVNTPPPVTPTGAFFTGNSMNWLAETTLNVDRELGPGALSGLLGFTMQEEQIRGSGFGGNFPDDNIETLNVAENIDGYTDEQSWSLMSGIVRVNYNLLERYIFTGTFRTDGSSRFGADNRWGSFPSGAIAWNVHNESFMEELSEGPIPQLKLRFSYGVTGNNQIGNYAPLGVVGSSNYVFGGSQAAGRTLNTIPNNKLGWERTEEFNLGVDATLYDHALNLTLEIYQRNTTDLLINREIPWSSGFSSVTENRGELRNRGIEFSMTSFNVRQEDVSWTTNFNISMNRNTVTNLPGGEDIRYGGFTNASYIHREGLPLASYVGYAIDGVYSPAQIQDSDLAKYPNAVPGNIILRDLNGDGQFTPDVMKRAGGDFTVLGSAYPDFEFGFQNTVTLGNFELRANVTGSFGGLNHRSEFFRTSRNIDGLFNVDSGYVENFYRSPENPGDGLTPSPLGPAFGRQQYRDASHSAILSESSNIWLRSAMVRYNFGENSQLVGFSNVSVYLTGKNLLILSPYPGNPDTASMTNRLAPGLDLGNYPLPRSFTFGVDVSL